MADGGKKASKAFGNAWRGAAAYHYYMLAQRQYYSGIWHPLLSFPSLPFPSLHFFSIYNYQNAYSTWVLTSSLSTLLTSTPPWYLIKNVPTHSLLTTWTKNTRIISLLIFFFSHLSFFHFFIFLSFISSFITSTGAVDASMKTSIKLCEYDDILEPRDIYSLLCLTSIRNKFYGICSKAFVKVRFYFVLFCFALPLHLTFFDKRIFHFIIVFIIALLYWPLPYSLSPLICPFFTSLHFTSLHFTLLYLTSFSFSFQLETLPNLSDVDRDLIQTLAVKIFVKHPPQDPAILPDPYIKCLGTYVRTSHCVLVNNL